MLSPPVARAGRVSITSPNHNVREKLNANAADFNTFRATASVNLSIYFLLFSLK